MSPEIVTIGVYGCESDAFFQALLHAHVDIFCDLRGRRGMRGPRYAFVNSERLQQRLQEMDIRYIHCKDLAPTVALRAVQKQEDELANVAKRMRHMLSQRFVAAYEQECLSQIDSGQFIAQLGGEANVICLFCVEREPGACHRSLVAQRLTQDLGLHVVHIYP